MTAEQIDKYRYKDGISAAEYTWRELKGFAHIAGRTWCMNCLSEVLLFESVRDNCPNDECYNFARGIDFWLTGEECYNFARGIDFWLTGEEWMIDHGASTN